ncbi:MAG: hypothetical protein ACFB0E_10800 [Leptolyngbyaceae cyanobacterium]
MSDADLRQVAARLNRVEAVTGENSRMIEQIAQYQAQAFQGLSELSQIVGQQGRNSIRLDERIKDINQQTDDRLMEYQTRTFQSLSELAQIVGQQGRNLNRLTDRVEQVADSVAQVNERVDSLAAASERFDRILDYLLGREGGRDNATDV